MSQYHASFVITYFRKSTSHESKQHCLSKWRRERGKQKVNNILIKKRKRSRTGRLKVAHEFHLFVSDNFRSRYFPCRPVKEFSSFLLLSLFLIVSLSSFTCKHHYKNVCTSKRAFFSPLYHHTRSASSPNMLTHRALYEGTYRALRHVCMYGRLSSGELQFLPGVISINALWHVKHEPTLTRPAEWSGK